MSDLSPPPPPPPQQPPPPLGGSSQASPPTSFPSVAPGSQDEKTLAVVMHALCLLGFPIVGPLIIWMMKKDQSAYLDAQGRELLNFQISIFIYGVVSFILCFVLVGFPMLIVLGAGSIILTIVGIVKAVDGVLYRFPLTLRML